MRKSLITSIAATLAILAMSSARRTDAVSIETVPVRNASNAPDAQSQSGSVGYDFRIAKFEVTNLQYAEFLNAVDPTGLNGLDLFNESMSWHPISGIRMNGDAADGEKFEVKLGFDNKPVILVSWYDAIRFSNWLHNGQGDSDTEDRRLHDFGR